MIGGLVLGVYVLGVYWTAATAARRVLDTLVKHARVDRGDRWAAAMVATLLGLIWPGVLAWWAFRRSLDGFRSTHEIESARQAELDALRRQARELGLPYPGEDGS